MGAPHLIPCRQSRKLHLNEVKNEVEFLHKLRVALPSGIGPGEGYDY
jgi:hypothetical protein